MKQVKPRTYLVFKSFIKVSLLILAILSLLLGALDLGYLIIPNFLHSHRLFWNTEFLFAISAVTFGLMNLITWRGIDRYGLGNILKAITIIAIPALVSISSFSPREEEYRIAPVNMPASCIRIVNENEVLPWHGKHYGFPIDFLHIYDQLNGNGLCTGFDPQWLFADWVIVLTPLYVIAVCTLEIRRRRNIYPSATRRKDCV